ncbi:hypothetical protein FJ872_32515 [Mesorhizobium sp. B2-5-9]|uniref:hypothetical protein n=1 Tax=unclassified Mesorhizobium TaxID=325217 RepID=UPI00112920D7|nr:MULTISPECIES: hypothetical protein [unclassified Mesorhizobium]TPJ96583.1 hypothetical protein FJ872_32515 [Mesorhizobium sp. B2-5-9]TPK83651.1 hypothetical protein FJ936_17770 [Mesorhizobium sp. B2-4-13]
MEVRTPREKLVFGTGDETWQLNRKADLTIFHWRLQGSAQAAQPFGPRGFHFYGDCHACWGIG